MRQRILHGDYIWRRPDWPHFHWDSEVMLKPLGELSHSLGELNGKMAMLGFAEKGESMLSTLTQEMISSSEIEGERLERDSVRSSIARRLGIEANASMPQDHYVEGLVDVMFDAIKHSHEPLSADRLFDWHAALFPQGRSGMYRITVADWRKGEEAMQVVSGAIGHERVHYEAPSSSSVPELMQELIDFCNSQDHSPLIMAAVAHLWFLTVHPFDDGNGRISRTLSDMLLARMDAQPVHYYSISDEINRNKKEYYELLERTQKGSLEITDWILWFFSCLKKAIDRALESVQTILHKSEYWDRFRNVEVNERQRKMINRLWDNFQGKLTTSKWAKICHCSQDTALRDINDLISKGMLKRSEQGGRSAGYLLA